MRRHPHHDGDVLKPFMHPEAKQLYLTWPDDFFVHPWFNDIDPTVMAAFRDFHAKHPDLLKLFIGFAKDLHRAGAKHFGMKGLAERVRWYVAVERVGTEGEDWKINNSYLSAYARTIMLRCPELDGMFELRQAHKAEEA